MNKRWLIGVVASVFALGGFAFVQGSNASSAGADTPVEYESGQPIAFPHDVHAGSELGQSNMDCQFCHSSAERSVDAGIPSVSTCWGCHQVIPGTNQPEEVAKIREYVEGGKPIPWVRIYKISDHTHFPHMRHINAGLACQDCHGEVQTTKVLNSRDPVWGGDNMGWCVDCHRQRDAVTDKQNASTDCSACHY